MQCPTRLRAQQGFAALLVLAVLVMVGAVSAYSVRLVTAAQADGAREVIHARAVQSARAGMDWARWRVQVPPVPQCPAVQTLTNLPGLLAPYRVTVRCTAGPPRAEGAATVRAYVVTSTACNRPVGGTCPSPGADPGPDYVQHVEQLNLVR